MIKEYKSIFRSSKFLYLWGSQILSQITINVMNFLLLTRIYTETGSTIATSLLWVAYSTPAIIAGPFAAATVDLFSRRKMLMVTNLLQALTILAYLFLNQHSVFILYAVVFIYSLLNQFYVPAEAAYLPSAVRKENLPQANSLFLLTVQASLILGFGFAGILQRLIGFNGTIILGGVFLFAAFISTSFLTEIRPRKAIPDEFEKAAKTFFNTLLEGYRFIKNNKAILYPILILLGFQAALAIIVVTLPVIAVEILRISASFAGISIAVPAGIGAFMGSIFISKLLREGRRKKLIIERSLGVLIFAVILLAYGIPYFPITLSVVITFLLIMFSGAGFVGVYLPTLTFLQNATPTWLRGRVLGNMYFMITLVSILPVLFSGTITEIFGIRTMLTILGLGAISVLAYSRRHGDMMIKESFKNEINEK